MGILQGIKRDKCGKFTYIFVDNLELNKSVSGRFKKKLRFCAGPRKTQTLIKIKQTFFVYYSILETCLHL